MASDPSGNLARRYRRLFRLPSLPTSVAATSIITIALAVTVGLSLKRPASSIVTFAVLTELVLLLTVGIDAVALKSGIATYRRLAAISILSNLVWLAAALVGSFVNLEANDAPRLVALVILGLLFAVSFRTFILSSIFYGRIFYALPLSLVQPVLLAIPIFELQNVLVMSAPIILAISLGVLYVIAMEVYLYRINNSLPIAGLRPLQLLQAFLSAWVLEDPGKLEKVFDHISRETTVSTGLLRIESSVKSALLVVPGIHPGPFHPVGSSNLPGEIYSNLKTNEVVPLTVHSISDHELNLSSKEEVSKYISTLKEPNKIDEGRSMTCSVVKTKGKATVTGIAFGQTCLVMLTQAPHGMEDFPPSVRTEIQSYSKEAGFRYCLVIDTHNSEGAKPNEEECGDAVSAAKEVVTELKDSKREPFTVGLSHSMGGGLPRDVGPGGVGLVLFGGKEGEYCLVITDANNAKLGFREELFGQFEKVTGARILEICTSDTHVTAARTTGAKGYLALGDVVAVDQFVKMLKSLYDEAKANKEEGSYSTMEIQSSVKTIGGEMLDQFSAIMDKTSNTAKTGAKLLAALGVVVVLLTIL